MKPLPAPITPRPYASERDLEAMYGLLMEGRLRTSEWRYAHLGLLAFNIFQVDIHLDLPRHVRLWHASDGRLVGYALLAEDPYFDYELAPELEGSSLEEETLAWAIALVEELRREDPERWGGPLLAGVRQDHAGRIAFLEAHGFRPGEYVEVDMIRPLDGPLPAGALPPGGVVREMEESDIPDRAAAYREVWQPWTVGNVSDADYARFMRLPAYRRDLDVLAVAPDGCIAAYVNGWLDPVNRIGDLGPVGAREAYRRQGYTRAALLECMRRMQELGMDRVEVSTGVENWPARGLYASVGFEVVNRYQTYVRLA